MQHPRRRVEHAVEIAGDETGIRAEGVDEPPILATHVHDQGLARGTGGVDLHRRHVDPVGHHRLRGEPTEDILAHAGADGDADPQPGQVDGGIGGSSADVEQELIDRHQLPRAGNRGMGGAT